MFEAPFRTGNAEKDISAIFDTLEQWAVKMRKVEANIKLLQSENELLQAQLSGFIATQATATTLSIPDIATEEI